MANNPQNTSSVDTNSFSKPAMVSDLDSTFISNEQYSFARNVVRNSKEGNLGTLGNEPSLIKCYSAPYKIIGIIPLPDDSELVFSTDDVNSEIGIGNSKLCTYTKLKNDPCLNFSSDFPINGVAKKHFQKGAVVTFTDKNNPVRRSELKKLNQNTSCNDILLWKKITLPSITVKKGNIGTMPDGSYSVVMAYSVDGKIFSDWYSITNRILLNSESGSNSLEVTINNLDKEFKQYSIAIVGNYIDPVTKGATKVAKIIGEYSTSQNRVYVTDFLNASYSDIKLSELIIRKSSWDKAGIVTSNSNYLLIADLVAKSEQNYQQKAFQIETEYVVDQVPVDYYFDDGLDISYYRDEIYDFRIHGVWDTGEETEGFHIAGPKPTANDLSLVSGEDVYEYDKQFNDCNKPNSVRRYQVENTASKMTYENNKFICNRRTLGRGKTGYAPSTEIYGDNKAVFGDNAGTPLRFHRMPDEAKVPRYSEVDGKTYINILGVRFKNIPKFDDPRIIGYKIVRSDRKGGNGTVVARGLMTNVRSYTDKKNNETVLYSNYTVNDLAPDVYLSSTQTVFKSNKETHYTPLADYHKDKFSFYSPHTLFEPRYSLGDEVKIECEEIADVTGKFEKVYKHPKFKLLNQFAFWLAAASGFIESVIVLAGKTTAKGGSSIKVGVDGGPQFTFDKEFRINSVEDLVGLDIAGYVTAQIKAGAFDNVISAIKTILTSIASLGLKIPYSVFSGIKVASEVFDTIEKFTGFSEYVLQYNALAKFNKTIPSETGNKRRKLLKPAVYVPSSIISIDGDTFNNNGREKTVYLHLNKAIADPKVKDNSRNTISGFGICNDITQSVSSIGSAFYTTIKVNNPNQYGQLGSTMPVSIHSTPFYFNGDVSETPVLYGGDCIIGRFQMMKKFQFFNQNLANTDFLDGIEYDYRQYGNIAYPRFWIDSTKYEFSNLLSAKVVNYSKFSKTTTSKHNLDCKKKNDGKSITRIDDAYMYTSNNCVLDFIVEADYNINFREKSEVLNYSRDNTNLSQIFRADNLEKREEFKISRVYSDLYTTEIFSVLQRNDFDPNDPLPIEQKNSVIYSLPSFNLQNADNWQYFLPNNFFAFSESDFGNLSAIHKLDQDRLMFLFSKSSPFISMGRDFLELEQSGRKITIGDGGLFAQDPREIMPTDNNYGACSSRYAFSNTHHGRFYPSESQGRLINFTEGLMDISLQGISFWCKNYMPIFLYKYFPDYNQVENPVSGVGYLTAFDAASEVVYFSKRDFSPKREYINDITYDKATNKFYYKGQRILLSDSRYFNDISWTLSYSPIDKSFISYHDWHPDLVVQTDNHFMTVKGNTVWKHNEAYDSFCKFYDIDYPFEIECISSSGQTVHAVRSLEYILEVYTYKNFGRDKFHVFGQNFDTLIVRNTEQLSPPLNLVRVNPDPFENQDYPMKTSTDNISFDIPFFKEENKYRVNMFWDAVKDRGEFSKAQNHLFPVDESGYKRVVNPIAIDINKPESERKKFRHYFNQFRFIKRVSEENKFIFKLVNVKKEVSLR